MKGYWFAVLYLGCLPALAGEETITLRDGVGKETVVANCITCHSLDYIEMNSRPLDRAGWDKTIAKMINVMGAAITEGDKQIILEYLSRQYGRE